jgi:hypothetical protein
MAARPKRLPKQPKPQPKAPPGLEPKLEYVFSVRVRFERVHWVRPSNTGMTRGGVYLDDGEFEGPNIRGRVIPLSGGDWGQVRADGVIDFDARYMLETHDGAVIYLQSRGYRWHPPEVAEKLNRRKPVDARQYYMRVAPKFEAPAGPYEWLNKYVFIGMGEKTPEGNCIHYYRVL